MKYILILTCSIFLNIQPTFSQNKNDDPDPQRFENEIEQFNKLSFNESKDRIVFTGSSSIRMWKDIQAYYPKHQIINTGFGGSHMSDLLYYLEETIIRFKPTKVFIYEGDNDIANDIPQERIINYTKEVIRVIKKELPNCEIILISPKPSVARWNLSEGYISLNKLLKELAIKEDNLYFADVWEVMLDKSGSVKTNIFIEDNLHMNKEGYDLWETIITPLIKM